MEAALSGGEVRKLHINYILRSKDGIEEDTHRIRIRSNSRIGVRLRDVKRWMTKYRGLDMPESFAWSYKRNIIDGFVWEDLQDDDLITPYSNNDYFLKGSEISSYHTPSQGTKQTERNASMEKQPLLIKSKGKSSTKKTIIHRRSLSDIEEELPESTFRPDPWHTKDLRWTSENVAPTLSTLPDDCMKVDEETSYSSLYLNIFNKNAKKINPNGKTPENAISDHISSTKSKGLGNIKMFRNLFTCRAIETNDSIVVSPVERQKKLSLKNCCKEAKDECKEAIKVHKRTNGEYSRIQHQNGAS